MLRRSQQVAEHSATGTRFFSSFVLLSTIPFSTAYFFSATPPATQFATMTICYGAWREAHDF